MVPVYDEEQRLQEHGPQLVDFVAGLPAGSELVFVDDGSGDGTAGAVAALAGRRPEVPVRLVRRPHEGKGAAVAAGLRAAKGAYAGFCDVDLATPLDQFERVMRTAQRAPVLAVGSRDLSASRLLHPEGPVRELLGRAYNRLLQATITPGITDTQCGAKAAAREVWAAILPACHETGFAWDAEAIAVARALGIGVREVPVAWSHDERSRVRVGRDGAAMVLATARIWRRVRGVRSAEEAADARRPPVDQAKAQAAAGEVFDSTNAELLMASDREHWWFRSKAALVATALRRTRGPEPSAGSSGAGAWLVDVGAGSGGVTSMLGWDPNRTVVAEGNRQLVASARRLGLTGIQASADGVPLADGSVEVVCLLDVIEHLADPVAALREARRVLAPGGRLVVNVPAHRWLWSEADEALGHVRRYTRKALRAELAAAGLEPTVLTHVFSWLVAPVWVTRRARRGSGPELGLDQTSTLVDLAAMVLTALERSFVGRLDLPIGTSVLCVAVRRER